MPTAAVSRAILFVFLAAILAAPGPSSAAAGAQRFTSVEISDRGNLLIPDVFDRVLSLLRNFRGKDGCHIDPDGRCVPIQKPEVLRKDGCHIDPHGRCIP